MKLAYKAFVVALLAASSSYAMQFQLTPEEKKACDDGGGCIFAPVADVHKAMEEAYQAGFLAAKEQCFAKRKKEV